jgi:hypothetical protein
MPARCHRLLLVSLIVGALGVADAARADATPNDAAAKRAAARETASSSCATGRVAQRAADCGVHGDRLLALDAARRFMLTVLLHGRGASLERENAVRRERGVDVANVADPRAAPAPAPRAASR